MSEASIQDGMVDFHQFCPMAAKTIEIMFEPKSLRQRAELIETTDLSPESLLMGMSTLEFDKKMETLFKSYDFDHNGTLDYNEFRSCLLALDFNLTEGETAALRVAADIQTTGDLTFSHFVTFFTSNLLHLEREKHLNSLQKTLHRRNVKLSTEPIRFMSSKKIISTVSLEQFKQHLETIFGLADLNNTGYLERAEFEKLILSLDIKISKFQLNTLLSELEINDSKLIHYRAFIPVCADSLSVRKQYNI